MLDIKPFQETLHKGYCGPACVKMVLAYYGINKDEEELAEMCKTDTKLGTTLENMETVLSDFHLLTKLHKQADFAVIAEYIRKGVPVIVDWFTRGRSDYPDNIVADGHYSVVVDITNTDIYLQDPEIGGLRIIALDDFLQVWFDFKGEYITNWEDILLRECLAVMPEIVIYPTGDI